ncbi:unnamed protein product [Dovyalis caffra]|uniref:Uncharacterized protein n=1 Tax=Dovyalis caffra TaxID=77055 RepID=A0AAV1SRI0_9ROSI|nr:unnamed protein product [Dovyalis caffra]
MEEDELVKVYSFVQMAGFKSQVPFDHLKRLARAYHGLDARKDADATVSKLDEMITENDLEILDHNLVVLGPVLLKWVLQQKGVLVDPVALQVLEINARIEE